MNSQQDEQRAPSNFAFRVAHHGLPRWEARTARFLRGEIGVPAQLLTATECPRCARCGVRVGSRGSHRWHVDGVLCVPACGGCAEAVCAFVLSVRDGTWTDTGVGGAVWYG